MKNHPIEEPNCSVIIINYNTFELTISAVSSILNFCTKFPLEIIVVDNGSETNDFKQLLTGLNNIDDKRVNLIRSRINTGFGGGNMAGIQSASGKYYAFIKSDTYQEMDSLAIMIDFLETHRHVSMVGGLAISENGEVYKKFLYGLGLRKELISSGILNFVNPRSYPSRRMEIEAPMKVDAISGSYMVCRAADFNEIGGFDTNLFLYYEEKDLAFRIKKWLKKEIYFLPDAKYIHLKGKSSGNSFDLRKELKISQFYAIRKNLGPIKFSIFYLISFLKFLIKAPFNNRNRQFLMMCLKGMSLSQSLKTKQKIKAQLDYK